MSEAKPGPPGENVPLGSDPQMGTKTTRLKMGTRVLNEFRTYIFGKYSKIVEPWLFNDVTSTLNSLKLWKIEDINGISDQNDKAFFFSIYLRNSHQCQQ